ncbi:Fatty acid synthase subunit beta, partial [Smittium mucronatum]
MEWVISDEKKPDLQYINHSFVSFPLIGLVQLLNTYILLQTLSIEPSEFSKSFHSLSGHSQGILSAYVLSISTDIKSFVNNSVIAIKILFVIGAYSHIDFPDRNVNKDFLKDSLENGEESPSHMLLVTGLKRDFLETQIFEINSYSKTESEIVVSIVNSSDSFVLSGSPDHLYSFCKSLRKYKSTSDQDQSRIPFSKRLLDFNMQFLQVHQPFHSDLMEDTSFKILKHLRNKKINFGNADMSVPIRSFSDGHDLKHSKDILKELVHQICVYQGDWIKSTNVENLTHIIDFGPGGYSGIGGLTERNKAGSGIYTIFAGEINGRTTNSSAPKSEIFESRANKIHYSKSWEENFGPKLVRLKSYSNGAINEEKIVLDTKFSRVMGKPPIMVAGMTPSTVSPKFVSAVLNSGYHIELAGGGYYSEASLRESISEIAKSIDPGNSISLNVIFLNVRTASFQIPLVQVMRREGSPVDGICISAGVPTLETCTDLINGLLDSGIRHISFKPGSLSSIQQVIRIANHNPNIVVILQWTGGRGGGHHSFEDFHWPIINSYSEIRSQNNLVLVAGSGFGGADDTLPYLTGEWSTKYGKQKMPFDGILLGSRMMVAKECPTSHQVKKMIVNTQGVSDKDWEKTYSGPSGGVISVISELGQPIHMIANRAILLWKEFDDTLFSLPREKMLIEIQNKKQYIIDRLNKDYQRLWFGKKLNGEVTDLDNMTYSEIVFRLIELLYLEKTERWIDPTYIDIMGDFLRRIEERFSKEPSEFVLKSYSQLSNPFHISKIVLDKYPKSYEQIIITEDVHYFLQICSKSGRKPVTFIPVLDKDFETWFKRDSLWQSEFLESVPNQDEQRVPVLQGPVAVKYSNAVDIPAKEILDQINDTYIQEILKTKYEGKVSNIPVVEYLYDFKNINADRDSDFKSSLSVEKILEVKIGSSKKEVPKLDKWIKKLSFGRLSWLTSLFNTDVIVRDGKLNNNNVKYLLKPRVNQIVNVEYFDSGIPKTISIRSDKGFENVSLSYLEEKNLINLNLNYKRKDQIINLEFLFKYIPETPYAMIHELCERRNQRISDFYKKIWIDDITKVVLKNGASPVASKKCIRVSKDEISRFCQIIENNLPEYLSKDENKPSVIPMDYLFAIAWDSMCRASIENVNASVLDVVHYSNSFEIIDEGAFLTTDDIIDVEARLKSVVNKNNGIFTTVEGMIFKGSDPYCKIITVSMYRGKSNDFAGTFEEVEEEPILIKIGSNKTLSTLFSKEWFNLDEEYIDSIDVGSQLLFKLKSYYRFKDDSKYSSVRTEGSVEIPSANRGFLKVGYVEYKSGISYGNPVVKFLNRVGDVFNKPTYFENGGYNIIPISEKSLSISQAQKSNMEYSISSGDFNPIHTNKYFSDFCGLPTTIVHGMWTSANTRKILENFASDSKPNRIVYYKTNFLDMVFPGEFVETRLTHIGMTEGKKIIKIETYKLKDETKVLEGIAHVVPPKTVYVFTGQGSQVKGMGMELYKRSESARSIWDSANEHMFKKYGFNLLEILIDNIKEKTVYFGGQNGSRIRSNYMSLNYQEVDEYGMKKMVPLFPGIDENSVSYTFNSADGLLNSTEFTQPLIMLYEITAFQDMVENNLVYKDIMFAGHSLGEFCALSALAKIIKPEEMVELIFYRGLAMQKIVKRNEDGSSDYGMIAFNPSRVSKGMPFSFFSSLIKSISTRYKKLLEVVNYNTEDWQYVIAGELKSLKVFSEIVDFLSFNPKILEKLFSKYISSKDSQNGYDVLFYDLISKNVEKVEMEFNSGNKNKRLSRGNCTIPLPGIDVPFHSSFLSPGVDFIRSMTHSSFKQEDFPVDFLEGRYIPNIVGKPFIVSREYFELVYKFTNSPIIKSELDKWNEINLNNKDERKRLGYIFMIEMLSYQFANPVQWISTQDVLFTKFVFEKMIEVGPSSVLLGMSTKTLNLKYQDFDNSRNVCREFLSYSSDFEKIFYLNVNQSNKEKDEYVNKTEIVKNGVSSIAKKVDSENSANSNSDIQVSPIEESSLSDVAQDIPDEELPTSLIITSIVAKKMKKSYFDISLTKSIKEIVNGKSALQNEIVGDIQREMPGLSIEKLEEIPLGELYDSIPKTVGKLGPYSSSLVSRLISSKMPVGLTLPNVKSYIKKTYGLGQLRSDSLLLLGITSEPEARLSTESMAHEWIKKIANDYSKVSGISYKKKSSISSGPILKTINSKEYEDFKRKNEEMYGDQLNVLANYLDVDIKKSNNNQELFEIAMNSAQKSLDTWNDEHGEAYSEGIQPIFQKKKVRVYDSFWNWAHHSEEVIIYKLLHGEYVDSPKLFAEDSILLANRSTKRLVNSLEYKRRCFEGYNGDQYNYSVEFGDKIISDLDTLIRMCIDGISNKPKYYGVDEYLGPKTSINNRGDIVYSEVPRSGINNNRDFIKSMVKGYKLDKKDKAQQRIIISDKKINFNSLDQNYSSKKNDFSEYKEFVTDLIGSDSLPYLNLRERNGMGINWTYNVDFTITYLACLMDIYENGINFSGKKVLITGCGDKSIGMEILKSLLMGGAEIIATTSRFNYKNTKMYQKVYKKYGAKGSKLILLPFNQGSQSDINNLIDYIYSDVKSGGLGWDLDVVIPFGGISANGREISDFDSLAELSHRIMMTNLIRLIGKIAHSKQVRNIVSRPAQVILPLSLNHGGFGGDGMYPESKIGIMTLFDRWYAESWSDYINIAGSIVGWSRGTSLMVQNNILAMEMEKTGARTFSTSETAYSIVGLLHPKIRSMNDSNPIYADISGGFGYVTNFSDLAIQIRKNLYDDSEIKKEIVAETSFDFNCVEGDSIERLYRSDQISPRSLLKLEFPNLREYESFSNKGYMKNMLNLDKTVVITGFGEMGPNGNSDTRWEIEAYGELSVNGCIMLGWIMGLIEYFNGKLKSGEKYNGWVDASSREPVEDRKIKHIYEERILNDSGIRIIDPSLNKGYNPYKRTNLKEVKVEKDMHPIITQESEAQDFKLRNGDKVKVWKNMDESWSVQFLKGSTIYLTRASALDILIYGQLPKGYTPERFGIPKDVYESVDSITSLALISVCEALLRSGIDDPYELYKYVHLSEVGNCIGSSLGGAHSSIKIIKDRFIDLDIQGDILQESFISSMSGWVNMLLLSSTGPIKIPVGSNATGVVSIDFAVDAIVTGKAKFMVAGAQDDAVEQTSYEFYKIGVSANIKEEFEKGRDPSEISRPFSSTSCGMVESMGSACEILTSAKLALDMGLPIYGIVAYCCTATDQIGEDMLKPGNGLLSSVRENFDESSKTMLDFAYRKSKLNDRRKEIENWLKEETDIIKNQLIFEKPKSNILLSQHQKDKSGYLEPENSESDFLNHHLEYIISEANRFESEALDYWNHDFYKGNPKISPLRGALSSFGLTADDIDVLACDAPSIKDYDINEAKIIDSQFKVLGRSVGNICPAISQKSVLGFSKGPASSYALNGLVQSMMTGVIPGNASCDNVDLELESYEYMYTPHSSIKKDYIKAGFLKSFGFGGISAELLIVNADYLYSSLSEKVYQEYRKKVSERKIRAEKYFHDVYTGVKNLVQIKESPPFSEEDEENILLNPISRVSMDPSSNSYKFNQVDRFETISEENIGLPEIDNMISDAFKSEEGSIQGVGFDMELFANINIENDIFIKRNFTEDEIRYCLERPYPHASFTGRWCAKESVIKAISSFNSKNKSLKDLWNMGEAAPLIDIEIGIQHGVSGAPIVKLHNQVAEIAKKVG